MNDAADDPPPAYQPKPYVPQPPTRSSWLRGYDDWDREHHASERSATIEALRLRNEGRAIEAAAKEVRQR